MILPPSSTEPLRRSARTPKPRTPWEQSDNPIRARKFSSPRRPARIFVPRPVRQDATLGEETEEVEVITTKKVTVTDRVVTTVYSGEGDEDEEMFEEMDEGMFEEMDEGMFEETDISEDEEKAMDTETEEHISSTYTAIKTKTTTKLDRKESLDSRASGDEYEIDGFVVEDGYLSSDEASSSGNKVSDSSAPSVTPSLPSPTPIHRTPTRTPTRTAYLSSTASSGLFVSEHPSSPSSPTTYLPDPDFQLLSNIPPTDVSAEEVAEEIMDAVTLFSRRCNRGRAPLRIRIWESMVGDEGVVEALEVAREAGLMMWWGLGDGTLGVRIGV